LPPHLREFRGWRNAILGTLLVMCGLASALIAMIARRAGDFSLSSIASIASLVFVALISLLVVPPLVRSSRREFNGFDFPFAVTAGGVIFLGIVAIVAFAAWSTGNNLLFMVFQCSLRRCSSHGSPRASACAIWSSRRVFRIISSREKPRP
jgi:Ca2+/H+ antiporter